uniref:Uncharacterized protein n=1 Tax=Meloidogyne floridensis TaxID=298350 RepID=A0A915PA66_9BILA
MEQSSSNLDLDNYNNENREDDDLMEGCSSNFGLSNETPSLANRKDLAEITLQRINESQKLTKQTSISLPDFCSMFSFAETTKVCIMCDTVKGHNSRYDLLEDF